MILRDDAQAILDLPESTLREDIELIDTDILGLQHAELGRGKGL